MENKKTKVYNRPRFLSRLSEEIERANRYQPFLSLIVLTINDFPANKKDGNRLIEEVTALLIESGRKVDIIAYLGEGKIALLLPETSQGRAACLAARLKDHLEIHNFLVNGKGQQERKKVRIGTSCYPADAMTEEELIEIAISRLDEANVPSPQYIYKDSF